MNLYNLLLVTVAIKKQRRYTSIEHYGHRLKFSYCLARPLLYIYVISSVVVMSLE